jgi:hypothetical protein
VKLTYKIKHHKIINTKFYAKYLFKMEKEITTNYEFKRQITQTPQNLENASFFFFFLSINDAVMHLKMFCSYIFGLQSLITSSQDSDFLIFFKEKIEMLTLLLQLI